MEDIKEENIDRYFLIKLKGSKGMLSIQEKRKLSPNEYHKTNIKKMSRYETLEKVEKTAGESIPSLGISEEPYKTYEFKEVEYNKINNFDLDGFAYDEERQIVFYGFIYGIPAIKKQTGYYDVITDTQIPYEVIENTHEILEKYEYDDLLDDLRVIGKNINVYKNYIESIIIKIIEGNNNRKKAAIRYKEKYFNMKQRENLKRNYKRKQHQDHIENTRLKTAPQREKVKTMILEIKNNN